MIPQIHGTVRRQSGAALMIAIFALVIISMMGIAVLTVSMSASRFSRRAAALSRAESAAQAGAEEARAALRVSGATGVRAGLVSAMNVVYIVNYCVNGVLGQPWLPTDPYPDPNYPSAPNPFGGAPAYSLSNPVSVASTFFAPGGACAIPDAEPDFKWARVNLETENSAGQVVNANAGYAAAPLLYDFAPGRFPTGALVDPNAQNVYQISAYAADPTGYKRTVIEEAASYIFPFQIKSTVTFVGPSPIYASPHSNNFNISGVDQATGTVLPAMGTVCGTPPPPGCTGANNAAFLAGEPFRPDYTHYPGAGVAPPAPAIVDLSPGGPMGGGGALPGNYTSVAGLKQIVAQLMGMAQVKCGGAFGACPVSSGDGTGFLDSTTPQITFVQGDVTLPGSGGGILLATGTVTVPNNVTWNGLLIDIGTGNIHFASNGGGHPNLAGALFLANICGNTGSPSPDLSNCNQIASPSLSTFNGGGNGGFAYNSAKISAAVANRSYLLLSYREQ
ncbi:MAG: pilus assembly PilX family protein [Terriglobales bacterium]